jgi:AAA15 family ATPase/GTPase
VTGVDMLGAVTLKNFGPVESLEWNNLSKINVVLGCNGSGKTFLLKAMYVSVKSIEEYKRGNEKRSLAEVLADKLYWTFQVDKIGDLVYKKADSGLFCGIELDDGLLSYRFGKDTARQIGSIENFVKERESNSIFLPAKEVLSLHQIILKSREQDKLFGFDDTYFDLAKALRLPRTRGKNYAAFASSRDKLEDIVGGKVEYNESSGEWHYKNKLNQKFNIGVTAEGIKKISILDTLLGNRFLNEKSIIFIDEPESALHPSAISKFLDIIELLAQRGIQFILATHSYFVIKKLLLLAQESRTSIPIAMFSSDGWRHDNLLEGMPDNSIIDESVKLYEEEVDLAVK